MPEHPLKAAIATSGLTRALKDGRVQLNGVDLEYPLVDWIVPAMRSMVRETKYDIAEMALGTYLCAKAFNYPFIAIPIFLTRNFHHTAIVFNVHSGITSPKDLEGRNVAVNRGYTVTTGLWAREMLQSEYGVNLKKITWFPTDDEHVEEYQTPLNVDYKYQGEDVTGLLLSGKVDAAVGDVPITSPDMQVLIPDAIIAGFDYFRNTGIYPINHGLVIKTSVLEEEPFIAQEIFNAFKASKDAYLRHLASGKDLTFEDKTALELQSVVGEDPFPFGLAPNLNALEKITQFAADQGITPLKANVENLFAVSTLDLT